MKRERASRFEGFLSKEEEEEDNVLFIDFGNGKKKGKNNNNKNNNKKQKKGNKGGKNKKKNKNVKTYTYEPMSRDMKDKMQIQQCLDYGYDQEDAWDLFTVKGVCQVVEKSFFRLTSAPDPNEVRPLNILQRAFREVIRKWERGEVEYEYVWSQLKAIRMDLRVQRIKNSFTVEVYESHGRIALTEDDMNEFNQCQTVLKELYGEGIVGNEAEFLAYKLLYFVTLRYNAQYQSGSKDTTFILKELSRVPIFHDDCVQHAFRLMMYQMNEDYHNFFILYPSTPHLGKHLIDRIRDRIRVSSLQKMVKTFKPTLPISHVTRELAFESEEECLEFLTTYGTNLAFDPTDNTLIITKTSTFRYQSQQEGSLI